MPNMTRRTFLWLTGGSGIALAADPQRKVINRLIPLVVPPENIPSGEWAFFATTCRECPAGCGMHVWHRDGRVTKVEGNPDHPVNRGGLCPRGQSALQGLYDPDRLGGVSFRPRGGKKVRRTWDEAFSAIGGRLSAGGRVSLVSNLQTGALAEVMQRFTAAFGTQRLVFYEPFHYEALTAAHREVFGISAIPDYRLDRCEFIISFAADFLETWVSPVAFASRFGTTRDWKKDGTMGRMAYVGPRLSMTAANADDFIRVPPGYERLVAVAMLKVMLDRGWARRGLSAVRQEVERVVAEMGTIPGVGQETIVQLARRFSAARGSVALAGPVGTASPQARGTAVAAALLNHAAGRLGDTVDFSREHALGAAATEADLESFFGSLGAGDVVVIHDANPAYSRPGVAGHLARAGLVVYLGTLSDETAELADWVLPIDYPLEAWGDYEPWRGVNSLMQPTLSRITDSRGAGDIFLELARRAGRPLTRPGAGVGTDFHGWLAARWNDLNSHRQRSGREEFWNKALSNGGFWQSVPPAVSVSLRPAAGRLLAGPSPAPRAANEISLWPWGSILLHDGRTANRGWIQEAPDPTTFIAWGNWIDLNSATARRLGIADGEVAELATAAGSLKAPVRVSEDVVENTAAIAFGQGHLFMGRNARGTGANVFPLLGSATGGIFPHCRLRRVGGKRDNDPTYTSPTREQHGRQIVQWVSLSLLRTVKPGEGEELRMPLPEGYRAETDFYPKREYLRYRWAMVIDLQRCIGCGACAVACYAENNICVMGKKQVGRQLEMAWLRVVPYRQPDTPRLRYSWIPLLCQHCDSAPCEPVCPVYASVHNEEGLNAQIYNRCIGTRYCSNNCPYKVRRFNWLNTEWEKPLDLQLNPEVTVRSRGVMEKCTFCVQRIRQAEYRAVRENRRVRDGEIQPACAQSCPTRVFSFGDLLDPESRVSQIIRTDPRRYQVLKELNTKPAVIYLRRIDNDSE